MARGRCRADGPHYTLEKQTCFSSVDGEEYFSSKYIPCRVLRFSNTFTWTNSFYPRDTKKWSSPWQKVGKTFHEVTPRPLSVQSSHTTGIPPRGRGCHLNLVSSWFSYDAVLIISLSNLPPYKAGPSEDLWLFKQSKPPTTPGCLLTHFCYFSENSLDHRCQMER